MNNYFDMKQGRCTQLEYFKANYVRNGSILEVFSKRVKTKMKHHFFVIKNTLKDYNDKTYTEIKLYDAYRGLIHKEKTQTPRTKINSQSWFEHLIKYGVISNYISLINDLDQE